MADDLIKNVHPNIRTRDLGDGSHAVASKDVNSDDILSTLEDILAEGVYTTPTHSAPTIGAVSTLALAANANRLYALIQNNSVEPIDVALGAAAVYGSCIRLLPNGEGVYEMSKKLGNLYLGVINAICVSGAKLLTVVEGV